MPRLLLDRDCCLNREEGIPLMSDLSPAVARPDHVPESAVYDFDMFMDPALITDPHERIRELVRAAPPVFWMVTLYRRACRLHRFVTNSPVPRSQLPT